MANRGISISCVASAIGALNRDTTEKTFCVNKEQLKTRLADQYEATEEEVLSAIKMAINAGAIIETKDRLFIQLVFR